MGRRGRKWKIEEKVQSLVCQKNCFFVFISLQNNDRKKKGRKWDEGEEGFHEQIVYCRRDTFNERCHYRFLVNLCLQANKASTIMLNFPYFSPRKYITVCSRSTQINFHTKNLQNPHTNYFCDFPSFIYMMYVYIPLKRTLNWK